MAETQWYYVSWFFTFAVGDEAFPLRLSAELVQAQKIAG